MRQARYQEEKFASRWGLDGDLDMRANNETLCFHNGQEVLEFYAFNDVSLFVQLIDLGSKSSKPFPNIHLHLDGREMRMRKPLL